MTHIVTTGDVDGRAHHWFAAFLACAYDHDTDGDYNLQHLLDRHDSNATLSIDYFKIGDTIEFRSEADFLIFKLKWS